MKKEIDNSSIESRALSEDSDKPTQNCEENVDATQLLERSRTHESEMTGIKSSKREILKHLYICSMAFMMNYAAYAGLVYLQSSVHIENGLGMAGLFAIYATSTLSTLLFVPFLIDFLGAKTAMVMGEIGIIAYTISNFYPSWYTIIPTAVFHGLTESASWVGSTVYVTYIGEKYWSLDSKKNTKDSLIYRFLCIFYTFVYLSQVIGNALVSIVLFSLKDFEYSSNRSQSLAPGALKSPNYTENYTATTTHEVITPTYGSNDTYKRCGANECQADFIYNDNPDLFKKYEPNEMSVYLLLALFLLMQITFTFVHAFALPVIPAKFDANSRARKGSSKSELEKDVFLPGQGGTSFRGAVSSELRATLHHIISPLNILIFPIVFYNGLFIAFTVTEFTRAYVSCTLGVEQIGLVIMVYGAFSMIISAASSKLIPLFGRNILYLAMFIMHMSVYALALYWDIADHTKLFVYCLSACLGVCDGAFLSVTQGTLAIYFEDRIAIAFSVKNFAVNIGIVAGTGWSASLCMDFKIYLLAGCLALSGIMYVFAENYYQKRVKSNLPNDSPKKNNIKT